MIIQCEGEGKIMLSLEDVEVVDEKDLNLYLILISPRYQLFIKCIKEDGGSKCDASR